MARSGSARAGAQAGSSSASPLSRRAAGTLLVTHYARPALLKEAAEQGVIVVQSFEWVAFCKWPALASCGAVAIHTVSPEGMP